MGVNPITGKVYVGDTGSNDVAVIDEAMNSVSTTNSEAYPTAVAVNPVTNEIYVASESSNDVTVIDGASDADVAVVPAGTNPFAMAVNPVTNKTYVANIGNACTPTTSACGSITVINGATRAATNITDPNASAPRDVAINPVTNKIYVANSWSNNLTVIDGSTDTIVATVPAGAAPYAVAVNPSTNKIYVANKNSGTITVVDGSTDTVATGVSVSNGSVALAVDIATNKIYVVNNGIVTVIDGSTDTVAGTVPVGPSPYAVAVNLVPDKIYVANQGDACVTSCGSITVIDGVTNATTTITNSDVISPTFLAVNPASNTIYVANGGMGCSSVCNYVSVIDGTSYTASVSVAGATYNAIAVNPVTGKVYLANSSGTPGGNNVIVITEKQVQAIPLTAGIQPLAGNVTGNLTPSFNFTAASAFSPHATTPDNVLFQVDTWQGTWTAAANAGNGSLTGQTPALQPGFHILYAYSTDGQEATSVNTGEQSAPLIGNLAAYGFLVSPPSPALAPGSLDFGSQAVSVMSASQSVTLSNSGGPLTVASVAIIGSNSTDFSETNDCTSSDALAAGKSCTINVTFMPSDGGPRTATLTVTDDAGGAAGSTQTATLNGTGIQATAILSASSLSFSNQAVSTTSTAQAVTVTNSGNAPLTFTSITPSGDFAETDNCVSGSITVGGTCAINVTFTPTAAGSRTGSLTLTDNAANSPQSVSLAGTGVTPYSLASNPSSASVISGTGSTTFTISAATTHGFAGSIALSCSGIAPASCAFNPASISPAQSSTLTVSGLAGASGGTTLNFTVNGTNGSQSASVGLTITIADFKVSSSQNSATITAGQTATYTISVGPLGGFNQAVGLSCTGAPSKATCLVSPTSVTLDGSDVASVTVSVTTTASTLTPLVPRTPRGAPLSPWAWAGLLGWLSVMGLTATRLRRYRLAELRSPRRRIVLPFAALLATLILWASCGGGGSNVTSVPGTPAGTYTLTLAGTSGSLSHSTTVTLAIH